MTTAWTGLTAGSPLASSVSIAVDKSWLDNLGSAPNGVLIAPIPAVGGAPCGADAVATASAARYDASLPPLVGKARRNDPHPGMFIDSSDVGLACRPGNVPQFCCSSADFSCGLIARTTGVVTNERLSLIDLSPIADRIRAVDTELAGIQRAGRWPRSAGQLPTKPSITWLESADLTPIFTQWSPTFLPDLLYRSANAVIRSAIDGSAITAMGSSLPTQGLAAESVRFDSTSPKNRQAMIPATTATTATRATITPTLTLRRPVSLLRCPP